MLKILHISGARGWGGNEQQLIDLIYELNKSDVINVVFGVSGSSLEKECRHKNIQFIAAKKHKLNKLINYKYLKQISKEIQPNILHLHTSDSLTTFVISDLLFNLNIPAVFSKKGMGRSSSFLSKFKYNYKNISAIICVSKKVKKEFSEILSERNKHKLNVIYDGISISRIKKPEQLLKEKKSKFLIGHIGNHVRAKNLPVLIKMMDVLVNKLDEKDIHLIQIGEFNDKMTDDLKKLIDDLNLNHFVTFTGFVPDASSYLSQFDIFVMSSEREGLPLTIYEAFYKKIPVVSTRAGGIPEIISDNINGFLVDVGDYGNLALKTKELLYNETKKRIFIQKSFDLFMNNYTSEICAAKTIILYKNLIK